VEERILYESSLTWWSVDATKPITIGFSMACTFHQCVLPMCFSIMNSSLEGVEGYAQLYSLNHASAWTFKLFCSRLLHPSLIHYHASHALSKLYRDQVQGIAALRFS